LSGVDLKHRIMEAVKAAMRGQVRDRLAALRLVQAEIKQYEVDQRQEADDATVLTLLGRMLKQRRDSIEQFTRGGREDLAAREAFEVGVIQEFMPQPLSAAEVEQWVLEAIAATGAAGPSGMGAVMAWLKPRLSGRADLGEVSRMVRDRLASPSPSGS
jgi:uncharacterized protein